MRNNILKFGSMVIILSLNLTGIIGCASHAPKSTIPEDPYESMNRKIFAFNRAIDKVIIRPVAKGYDFILPTPAKKGVTNFFSNLDEVPNILNDTLQADPAYAISDTWRLILNTTIGIGGLFDVATPLGLPKHHQDFGLTLAKWGSKDTPYIVLPIFGPHTLRDAVGLPFDVASSVTTYIQPRGYGYALVGLDLINTRASFLDTDKLVDESFDPYVFVRDAYLQRRAYLTHTSNNNDNNAAVVDTATDDTSIDANKAATKRTTTNNDNKIVNSKK